MTYATATKAADWGECCFCRNDTRTIWHGPGNKRIAYACTFVHLTREYPAYQPERREIDRRASGQIAAIAGALDRIADKVVSDGDYDETAALRDLDAVRVMLTGKPCQPVT